MKPDKVEDHLNEKLKDPYFKELYELEDQKLQIVKRIVAYRVKNELSQKQLADKAGVSQQHISNIENGVFSDLATVSKVLLLIGQKVQIRTVPIATKQRKILAKALKITGRSANS